MLNEIKSRNDSEYRIAIRQFKLNCSDIEPIPQFICEAANTNSSYQYHVKAKLAKLDSIKESHYEDDESFKPTFSLQQMEQRVCTSNYSKQQRGQMKRLSQLAESMDKAKELRELERCHLRIQNDPGATHCNTNKKSILQQLRHITPLPISGVASDTTALFATAVGMLTL